MACITLVLPAERSPPRTAHASEEEGPSWLERNWQPLATGAVGGALVAITAAAEMEQVRLLTLTALQRMVEQSNRGRIWLEWPLQVGGNRATQSMG